MSPFDTDQIKSVAVGIWFGLVFLRRDPITIVLVSILLVYCHEHTIRTLMGDSITSNDTTAYTTWGGVEMATQWIIETAANTVYTYVSDGDRRE
jgi:hypothetical protein